MKEIFKNVRNKLAEKYLDKDSFKNSKKFKPRIKARFRKNKQIINKNIDDYYDIIPGKILNIPNDYAKGMKLMIDKKRLLPLVIEVYDDKGIYEKYEYHNLIVNPSFEDEEFSMYCNDYGF